MGGRPHSGLEQSVDKTQLARIKLLVPLVCARNKMIDKRLVLTPAFPFLFDRCDSRITNRKLRLVYSQATSG